VNAAVHHLNVIVTCYVHMICDNADASSRNWWASRWCWHQKQVKYNSTAWNNVPSLPRLQKYQQLTQQLQQQQQQPPLITSRHLYSSIRDLCEHASVVSTGWQALNLLSTNCTPLPDGDNRELQCMDTGAPLKLTVFKFNESALWQSWKKLSC